VIKGLQSLCLLALLAASLPAFGASAAEEPVEASRAIMVDTGNGNVLHAVAPDATFPPGNLAKLMTMAVIFEAIAENRISGQTPYKVSERAWRTGGAPSRNTTMFAKLGSSIAVWDLLRGTAIVQANDAAIVLAEGFSVSEDNFVLLMNAMADRIGLKDTRYANATGLPAPGQTTTARDTARLVRHLIDRYPEFYKLFSESEINWSDIFQRNKNPYLGSPAGTDGGTVGFVDGFGHIAVASSVRNGRRLVAVLGGLPNPDARDQAMRELLELGFTGFVERELFASGAPITEARVFGGKDTHVTLVAPESVRIAVPREAVGKIVAKVSYDGPLRAPLRRGAAIATLRVWRDGQLQREVPLQAAEDIDLGGLVRRASDGVRELAIGAVRSFMQPDS
jgi:D-alanyl-D-alanine carboxypeptidase (penicillin-binding protein 5/6)